MVAHVPAVDQPTFSSPDGLDVYAAILTTSRPIRGDGSRADYGRLRPDAWAEALVDFWRAQPWAGTELGQKTLQLVAASFSDETKEGYTTHVRK